MCCPFQDNCPTVYNPKQNLAACKDAQEIGMYMLLSIIMT